MPAMPETPHKSHHDRTVTKREKCSFFRKNRLFRNWRTGGFGDERYGVLLFGSVVVSVAEGFDRIHMVFSRIMWNLRIFPVRCGEIVTVLQKRFGESWKTEG